VNNAVKFTPKEGTIRVALSRENSQTVIDVSDDGQGIKPDFLPHIFERFRQENATTRRNQGGLGLGLAIAKHLIEMHGGTIVAQSEGEGRGATFFVRLPVAAVRSEEPDTQDRGEPGAAPKTLRAQSAAVNLAGVCVLVVEDERDARTVLRRVLTAAGADVLEAADVASALGLLASSTPDVLVSDVGMPNQDGYDLMRAIRARLNGLQLPAIALTAFARSEDRQLSLQAGFEMHLAKPVDADELLTAVASLAARAESKK
jgi:CheY-like chemotaxis protein